MASRVEVRRSHERFHTRLDWLDSRHSFSFGEHFDPRNTHHGLLVVSNDDIVWPESGFPMHPHSEMEILTWVLDGELEHRDSLGGRGIITPGLAQRMSAGTGISHSEMNPSSRNPVHFIQMWVLPDQEGRPPSYEQKDVSSLLRGEEWVCVASGGRKDAAIRIGQKEATLWAARLSPRRRIVLPGGLLSHVFIARGGGMLEETGVLGEGDAVRLTGADGFALTADSRNGAEVLVWTMG